MAVNAIRIPRTESIRERDRWRLNQDDDNSVKANKVISGTENNLVSLTSDGDIKDSGIAYDEVVVREANIVYPTDDYVVQIADEKILVKCSVADINITLPVCTARTYDIEKIDNTAFKVIIKGQTGETINGEATFEILWQYESVSPTKTNKTLAGSDWKI